MNWEVAYANNCPIRERTADGVYVGRCWMWLTDRKCPRHGDVSAEVEHYLKTGRLSNEKAFGDRALNAEVKTTGGLAKEKE